MGNYATQADLKGRYEDDREVAEMTLDVESGTPDTDVLDEVIDGAEGEINSYLANRYRVPVDVSGIGDAQLTADLKSLTLDIACWRLETRVNKVSESRQAAYDRAVSRLGELAKGTVLLPATAAPSESTSRADVSRYGTAGTGTDSNRLFTRSTQGKL